MFKFFLSVLALTLGIEQAFALSCGSLFQFEKFVQGEIVVLRDVKRRRVNRNKSGLTAWVIAFLKERNRPLQVENKIKELESLVSGIERTPLGDHFGLSAENLEVLVALKATRLRRMGRNGFVREVNRAIEVAGEGEKMNREFVDRLAVLSNRLNVREVSQKLEALAGDHVVIHYYGDPAAVYFPGGKSHQPVIDAYREVQKAYFAVGPRGEYVISGNEVKAVTDFVDAVIRQGVPDYYSLSTALRMLEIHATSTGGPEIYTGLAIRSFDWAVEMLAQRVSVSERSAGLFRAWNKRGLVDVVSTVLLSGFTNKLELDPVIRSFLRFYRSEGVVGLQLALKNIIYIHDEKPETHLLLKEFLEKIRDRSRVETAERNEFAEAMYLGFVSVLLDDARFSDGRIGRGGGFHNAIRIRTMMEDAARATELYVGMNMIGPQTVGFNFTDLAKVFRGLKYNNLGGRPLGPDVDLFGPFGIEGVRRTKGQDVYSAVVALMIDMMQGDQPQLGFVPLIEGGN